MTDTVVIVAARRTPIGGFQGSLSPLSAIELGAAANKAALEDSKVAAEEISEVISGCVLPAGLGQAPARQAALQGYLQITRVVGAAQIKGLCQTDRIAARQLIRNTVRQKTAVQDVDLGVIQKGRQLWRMFEPRAQAPLFDVVAFKAVGQFANGGKRVAEHPAKR